MKTYDELKALIEQRGVHPEFGDVGEGWGIEQNPHELATFLVAMQQLGVTSCLEIGTGYKGGLSRFLAQDMGWRVTTVDIVDYGHKFEGVDYFAINHPRYGTAQFFLECPIKYDLVFIDGDHSFDSVNNDFVNANFVVKKVVAFHDIAGFRDCEGVDRFWRGIARTFQPVMHSVIAENKAAGIGWITPYDPRR